MRYECDEPGFSGCFLEVTDAWKRRELRDYERLALANQGEEWLALVASKIVDLRLDRIGAPPILDAAELTEDALEEMDNRLFTWFSSAIAKAKIDVQSLGETSARRLWPTSATETTATETPPAS